MTPDEASRFWTKVGPQVDGACWRWLGALTSRGAGAFRIAGRNHTAHKAAYEHLVGPVPLDHTLVKTCGRASCVNPAHHKVARKSGAGRPKKQTTKAVINGEEKRPNSIDWMPRPGV